MNVLTIALEARYRLGMPGRPQPAGVDLPGLLYLVCVFAVLFIPVLLGRRRPPPGPSDPGSDDGGGSGPRQPPTPPNAPRGGIPLPDAEPAPVRLRDHDRLADRVPTRRRRPAREPDHRPVRTSRGRRMPSARTIYASRGGRPVACRNASTSLLHLAAGRDRPGRLDLPTAVRVQSVVEIDGRVDVGG